MKLRTALLAVALACFATSSAHAASGLPLVGERFLVTAEWRLPGGASGQAEAVPLTSETGLFWFFSPTNVELVVKVIDACAAYDRFWVFASGLTNVEVTLTVEDTWSGQRKQYHRAGGALFAPLADTATFNGCGIGGPACGQGTRADVEASPRADAEAEALALLLGDGPVATTALYERLRADLAAIRGFDPAAGPAVFHNIWWDPQSLLLELTPSAFAAVGAGTYEEWDCLNAWYRGSLAHVYSYIPWVLLEFEGLVHPLRVAADYAALAGVVRGEANVLSWPAGEPAPTTGLCAIAGPGTGYDYFFEAAPAWRHYRVAAPGAAPQLVGTWNGAAPAPAWAPRLDECKDQLNEAATGSPL